MKKYNFIIYFLVLFSFSMSLPGDFFKYDMYSIKPMVFKQIKYYKNGVPEIKTIDELDKYLYHRTLIDEAHPSQKELFIRKYIGAIIKKEEIDSVSILINDREYSFK